MKLEDQIKVQQAFGKGRIIESRPKDNPFSDWKPTKNPIWDFSRYEYRIIFNEPVAQYVPVFVNYIGTMYFKSSEEASRFSGAIGSMEVKILFKDEE